MRLCELRDALELAATAEDILLRRPTSERRGMEEFQGHLAPRRPLHPEGWPGLRCSHIRGRHAGHACFLQQVGRCTIPERLTPGA